ncbi:MAG TPA: hypothetical protein ENN30_00350 [Candidatus Woesearchaeota archaeon]|nr:hypothetical protein [Candidatus Woesearchaeota archaeon]
MPAKQADKKEQVGFHKGALDTLIKERQELFRLITIVDQLIKAHVSALQQLGVKISKSQKQDLEKELK